MLTIKSTRINSNSLTSVLLKCFKEVTSSSTFIFNKQKRFQLDLNSITFQFYAYSLFFSSSTCHSHIWTNVNVCKGSILHSILSQCKALWQTIFSGKFSIKYHKISLIYVVCTLPLLFQILFFLPLVFIFDNMKKGFPSYSCQWRDE